MASLSLACASSRQLVQCSTATADFMFALISSEDLAQQGQIMVKQLKNRYADPDKYKRFVIGIEKMKMRLYDVEDATEDIVDDSPVYDKTPSGQYDREKFKGFK